MNDTQTDLFTVPEAAAYLRCSKSYLDKLRVLGGGPPYLRLGKRRIVYRKVDLDAWMNARRFDMTAQYEQKR